eukprot:15323974-Ditylum_brightwellii.AAC.1
MSKEEEKVNRKASEERNDKQIKEKKEGKRGVLTKRAVSTTTCLRREKANYGIAMDIAMEPAVEKQKDGMFMNEHLEEAIRTEEALWAEAKEKERQEYYQTLM